MRALSSIAVLILLALALPSYAAEAPPPVTMTRAEANTAFNTLSSPTYPQKNGFNQYETTIKQGGQDVIITRFLDVTPEMRSTLVRDYRVLHDTAMDTAKLHEDAKKRIDADEKYKTTTERAVALEAEDMVILQQKVDIVGLTTFTDSDLQPGKNPQVTIPMSASLAPLMKKD